MYGMYGSVDSIGSKSKNPFITKPGVQESGQSNPFTANNNNNEDKTNFDPQKLFNSGTVGLQQGNQELEKRTVAIA